MLKGNSEPQELFQIKLFLRKLLMLWSLWNFYFLQFTFVSNNLKQLFTLRLEIGANGVLSHPTLKTELLIFLKVLSLLEACVDLIL